MESNRPNIFLIGARATGKTTVGRALAQQLAMEFVDLDKRLVERDGRMIREIVAESGWQGFREQERQLLEELITTKGTVIATGGGAILHQEIWPRVMESALVVWLKADIATVSERLRTDKNTEDQRPSLTGSDPTAEAIETMRHRDPLYKKGSHLVVNAEQSIQDIVENINKQVERLWQEAHLAAFSE